MSMLEKLSDDKFVINLLNGKQIKRKVYQKDISHLRGCEWFTYHINLNGKLTQVEKTEKSQKEFDEVKIKSVMKNVYVDMFKEVTAAFGF